MENNATGQLANIIKMNVGHANKIQKYLKYDGTPFLPNEIIQIVQGVDSNMATFKDFRNNVKPNWCPGCGDFSVQAAIQRAAANVGLSQKN